MTCTTSLAVGRPCNCDCACASLIHSTIDVVDCTGQCEDDDDETSGTRGSEWNL